MFTRRVYKCINLESNLVSHMKKNRYLSYMQTFEYQLKNELNFFSILNFKHLTFEFKTFDSNMTPGIGQNNNMDLVYVITIKLYSIRILPYYDPVITNRANENNCTIH